MAQETIIKIGTKEAVKNIQDLKNNISEYKKKLSELPLAGKEYKEMLVALQQNQAALRNAMHATTASMQEVTNAATGANVAFDDQNKLVKAETLSYNELVRELDILKQQWRATTDEGDRAKLGEQINSVNDRLKKMDESVGVYGRNVGNYVGSLEQFAKGFGAMGKGAQSVIGPIKGAAGAMKAMSSVPLIAVLGVLATIIQTLIDKLKSSEEGTQAMTAAMAPFAAIGDVVTNILQGLGKVVVWVVEGFNKLAKAIFGTNEQTQKRIELAKMEKQLAEQSRETLVKNAEAERDIADLRARSADKLNYSAAERIEFLKEAGEKEKEIAARALEDAKLQYEIIKAKNALAKSSKQELDKEAEAYANLVKAETSYYQSIRTINAGISRTMKEMASEGRAAAKEREDARKAELEAYKGMLEQEIAFLQVTSDERLAKQKEVAKLEYETAVKNAKDKIKNQQTLDRTLVALKKKYDKDIEQLEREHQAAILSIQLKGLENDANEYAKGTKENLRALLKLRRAELETLHKEEGESDADFRARQLAAQWAYAEAIRALNTKLVEETTEELSLAYAKSAKTQEQTLAYEYAMAEARVNQIRTLGREAGETETAYLTRIAEAEKEAADKSQALLDYQDAQALLKRQNDLAALEEGSQEYLDKAVELKAYELDTLHRLEEESDEDFRARQLAAQKDYDEAVKASVQNRISTLTGYADAVSGLFSAVADMYESGTDVSEAEARKAKNLRIAGSVIDMLSGAVGAYTQAVSSMPPPAGPIIGAVNAATVVATSLANIAKMKAQAVDKNSSATTASASVPAPSVTPQVQEVRNVTSASEEERLNKMAGDQRVYILDSDLQAAADDRAVQVAETTF